MLRRLLSMAPMALALANTSSAPRPRSTTSDLADATVNVGHIFGQGGTDGLILYALVLSTFLMFLVAGIAIWIGYRSHTLAFKAMEAQRVSTAEIVGRKDDLNSEQTRQFTQATEKTANATQALAVAMAGMVQEHQAWGVVMAQREGMDHRLEALLKRLGG